MASSLSNMQYYLADYNNDGAVNVVDIVELQSALPAAANISEQNKIDALNKRLEEYYISQIGVDFNEK